MFARIVKKTEITSDPYKVGHVEVKKKGLLLQVLEKHRPNENPHEYVKAMEEKIIDLGLRYLETKASQAIEFEKNQMIIQLQEQMESALDEMNEGLVDLVMDIAEKFCRKKASEDKSIIQAWVKEALSRLGQEKSVTMRLNPSEAEIIQTMKQEILESREGLKELIIQFDPEMEQGGVVVTGETMVVDSSVKTRLKEIRHNLKGQHES
ncbi:MAG: FliH/SctL family protein [Elusimicrobiota bacterium]